MSKKRKYLFISIAFFVLGIILSYTYRQYIYKNNIFDFHFADTIGNLVAVPSSVCFFLAISRKDEKLEYLVGKIVLIYIGYEFLGLLGIHGVFDWYDIIATIFSGIITYFILKRTMKEEKQLDLKIK